MTKKKDYSDIWKALISVLFFWLPLINVLIALPVSVHYSLRSVFKAKKQPEKYASMWLGIILLIWSASSFIIGIILFIISSDNITFNIIWVFLSIISMVYFMIKALNYRKKILLTKKNKV